MSASPDDPFSPGGKPAPARGRTLGAASRWASGVTVTLLLLIWFMPSFMSWKLTILLGAAVVAYAGWLARQEHAWLQSAQVVSGKVIELIPIKGSRGRPSYSPRIRYTTPDGTVHTFLRPSARGPAGITVGAPLAVAYHDATPQDLRILTFGLFYGVPAFLAALGICLMLLGAAFVAGSRYVPRLYLQRQALPSASPGR